MEDLYGQVNLKKEIVKKINIKNKFEQEKTVPCIEMFFILSLASVKYCTFNTIRNLYLPVDTRIINQLSLDFRRVSNSLLKIELLSF